MAPKWLNGYFWAFIVYTVVFVPDIYTDLFLVMFKGED